jgi:hypothetical protein
MKQQLEITFETNQACRRPFRRQQRRQRAQWWFRKMRHAVDTAFDWRSASLARPEQIYFPLERR